jgi:hypothetical protein
MSLKADQRADFAHLADQDGASRRQKHGAEPTGFRLLAAEPVAATPPRNPPLSAQQCGPSTLSQSAIWRTNSAHSVVGETLPHPLPETRFIFEQWSCSTCFHLVWTPTSYTRISGWIDYTST